MNLLHLKYATEVANTGSLNKAAENLYMNQANLSRAIKELETSLNIVIFDRSSKGMLPTPVGEEFLQYARKILAQVDEVEELYKTGEPTKQRFSISVPRASYISEAFSQFSKAIDMQKPAELFYKETNAMRAIKNILESNYNLGIIRYYEKNDKYFKEMLDEKGLTFELVAELNYVLVMSAKHELAEKDDIRFEDLNSFIEIAHADPFVPSMPASAVLKEELSCNTDKHIFVFDRASQFELLSENPVSFMWVSPIPEKMLKKFDLVQKRCSDNKRIYKDMLIYRKGYQLSELDKLFVTELCMSKRKYLTF